MHILQVTDVLRCSYRERRPWLVPYLSCVAAGWLLLLFEEFAATCLHGGPAALVAIWSAAVEYLGYLLVLAVPVSVLLVAPALAALGDPKAARCGAGARGAELWILRAVAPGVWICCPALMGGALFLLGRDLANQPEAVWAAPMVLGLLVYVVLGYLALAVTSLFGVWTRLRCSGPRSAAPLACLLAMAAQGYAAALAYGVSYGLFPHRWYGGFLAYSVFMVVNSGLALFLWSACVTAFKLPQIRGYADPEAE